MIIIIWYGGIWCNVFDNSNNCDNKIKSFKLTIYNDANLTKLQTNYMMYSISSLIITVDKNITCIGDIICGEMAYTTENNGNRYFW